MLAMLVSCSLSEKLASNVLAGARLDSSGSRGAWSLPRSSVSENQGIRICSNCCSLSPGFPHGLVAVRFLYREHDAPPPSGVAGDGVNVQALKSLLVQDG